MTIDADRIRKPVRKLRKFFKKSPKRPSSGLIHNLRTNSRRVETAIDALGLSSHKNERRLLRDLARVRKRAGKVRDMDVLVGYTLTANLNGEQDCLVQLLEILGANRAKHVKKLRALVGAIGPRLRRRLKRSASKLENLLIRTRDRHSAPSPPDEAVASAVHLSGELKDPPHLGKENSHPYRIKVKKLRYVLQLSERADPQEFVNKLGKVKDAIGEWHDWQELIAIAERELDHGPKCKLLPKLRSISETKYESAFALTGEMRHTFVDSRSLGRGRPHAHKPRERSPAQAAISAISA
jgi:CHAD domain-containing protein